MILSTFKQTSNTTTFAHFISSYFILPHWPTAWAKMPCLTYCLCWPGQFNTLTKYQTCHPCKHTPQGQRNVPSLIKSLAMCCQSDIVKDQKKNKKHVERRGCFPGKTPAKHLLWAISAANDQSKLKRTKGQSRSKLNKTTYPSRTPVLVSNLASCLHRKHDKKLHFQSRGR